MEQIYSSGWSTVTVFRSVQGWLFSCPCSYLSSDGPPSPDNTFYVHLYTVMTLVRVRLLPTSINRGTLHFSKIHRALLCGDPNSVRHIRPIFQYRLGIPLNNVTVCSPVTFNSMFAAVRTLSKSDYRSIYLYCSGSVNTTVSVSYLLGGFACQLPKEKTVVVILNNSDDNNYDEVLWKYTSLSGLTDRRAKNNGLMIQARVVVLSIPDSTLDLYESLRKCPPLTTWKQLCDDLSKQQPTISLFVSDPILLHKVCFV